MKHRVLSIKKVWILKTFMVLIIFLFSRSIYTQNSVSEQNSNNNQNPFKTTIVVNRFLDTRDLFTFNDQPLGIKAITEDGKVEIRMYHANTYNNDQKRDNPSFLLGFYSEGVDNNAEYIQTDWETKACYGNAFISCDSPEADSQTVSSTQASEVQKRVLEAYKKEYDESTGFKEVTNKLLKVVIEIDYDLPQDFYNDFTFELYLPGIGLLKHADFITDTDNDGFPDGIDACVNTPGTVEGCPDEDEDFIKDQTDNNLEVDQCIDVDMPGLTVETDPNSDRLGCAIVPTAVAGDNVLTANEAIAGDQVMISKDRSCFFSVKGGKFRTYEAKYYESVMNSPLDTVKDIEFIHDIIDEFDFDDLDRDGVVDGYDFQDLDGDGIDDDNFVDSNNDGIYESPDYNDLPSNANYEFELYHNNESSGLSFKQNGETFASIYEHVFDDASSILLTNQASCNLFPVLKESHLDQIENKNYPRNTRELQFDDPDFTEMEIDLHDDLEFRQILRVGDVKNLKIGKLSNRGVGETAIKIKQIEDPFVDDILRDDSTKPIINQLVSENGLYTFSPDSEFAFYDLKTYRYKIWATLLAGTAGIIVGPLVTYLGGLAVTAGLATANPLIFVPGVTVVFAGFTLSAYSLQAFGLAGWTLATVPPKREVLQTKSIQLRRDKPEYDSGEPVIPMYVTEINESYTGEYLDHINTGSLNPVDILATLRSVDELGHRYCPSYHAELNEDGAFVMTRDEYGNGINCKTRRRRKIQSPKEVEVFSTAEKTGGGVGRRLLVSNFGNLVVKDDQGCTRWDLFSQLGDKDGNPIKFPDVTDMTIDEFTSDSNSETFLEQSTGSFNQSDYFTKELFAGDDLTNIHNYGSDSFVFMENGASVLYDYNMNVKLDFNQELGPAKSMRLNSKGEIITYDCEGNIISTIYPSFNQPYMNHMKENYPGIFIGVDYDVNGSPALVLYAGRDDLGLPIFKYSNNDNKTGFNPFPIFNSIEDINTIIASDQLFERNDIIMSEDENAIVRHIYNEGIHIFTREEEEDIFRDRSEWTHYKTLLTEEQIRNDDNTIANLIKASGQKLIYGATYRLEGNGNFILDDFDFSSTHQVFDNVPITSIFENNDLETDFTHLISQNLNCLATVNDLAINIYRRESIYNFDFSTPYKTIAPETLNGFNDGHNTRFYVDKRGALKFVSGNNQILFESEPRLKLPASSLTGNLGNRFALTLNNDCSLVTNRVNPNDGSIPPGRGNEWDSSDDNRDGLVDLQNSANTLFEILDAYDEIVAEESILPYVEDLPVEDDGNLWDHNKRIPFLTYANAQNNLYCRASSLFGELVLEDYYTGEIIWHQPNLSPNAFGDSYIRLSDHATNNVRHGGFRVIDPNSSADLEVFNSLYHIPTVHKNFDSHRLEVGLNLAGNECALNYIKTIGPSEIVEWSSDLDLISTQTTPGSKQILGSKEELLLSELASENTANSISSIEIFPNPSENGELNIISKKERIWKTDIMALNGTLITTINKEINKSNRTKIDIHYLKQGVYILKFYNENESIIASKKLIVD